MSQAPENTSPARPEPTARRRVRMVVVDNSTIIRLSVQRLFEAHAHVELVGIAADGAGAMEMIATLRPDLVVTDLQMPGVNGLSLTRWLAEYYPATRVIVMSAHDAHALREACNDSGAHGVIEKSSLPIALPREIERLFGERD